MGRVRVKICGVRTLEEALAAYDAGADALGFNFWPRSPRYVTPHAAREIIKRLYPFNSPIGVFVNQEQRVIEEIVADVRLSAVQLHGDESPEFCALLLPLKMIKAVRVVEGFNPQVI